MFTRILIPLDGSSLAERAIPHAEQFARIFGANIVLLRVLEVASDCEDQLPTNQLNWQIRKAEAEVYMRGIAARIRENLNLPARDMEIETENEDRVEYVIRVGKTAENIIDFAHHEHIDLLVISSHGSGGLSRWNMSSVILKVIDLIYMHLLVVRSFYEQEEINDRIHYRKILLPVDSSRRGEYALSAAIALAQGEGMLERGPDAANLSSNLAEPDDAWQAPGLILAAIVTPPEIPIPRPYPDAIRELSDQLLLVSREAVHAYLSEMKVRVPVESEIRVIESDNVSSAIYDLGSQADVDLVLMSAHGYSGQFTQPYGNVTRSYMEHGSKPILVIQDVTRSQVGQTAAAVAADISSGRYKIQEDRSRHRDRPVSVIPASHKTEPFQKRVKAPKKL